MTRREIRRWYGLCAALACLPAWCGEDAVRADDVPSAPSYEQILVFNSGRIVKGRVSRSPNGYVVEHPAGRMVVPFEEMRVIGDNLSDAYRRLKETFVNPTAATHYELALWCAAHQLEEQTRAELVMALDRDPEHGAARDMLTRIDAKRQADRKRAQGEPVLRAKPRIVGGIELPEVESLAGLSRETAAHYTLKIQPLLTNKCGNASCHGPQTQTTFRIDQTRGTGPGHRVHSERNLAMVLKQIDQARPAESRLLQVGTSAHGGMNRAQFFGPAGEKQLKLLRNWVRVASKELSHDARLAAQPNRLASKQPAFPKTNGPKTNALKSNGPVRTVAADEDDMASQASVTEPAEDAAEVEDEELTDAFDPEAFNRRYHGTSAKKTPPPRDTASGESEP